MTAPWKARRTAIVSRGLREDGLFVDLDNGASELASRFLPHAIL